MQQIIWDKLSFQLYLLTFKFTKSNSKELQKSKKLSPLSQMPLFHDLYTIAIMQYGKYHTYQIIIGNVMKMHCNHVKKMKLTCYHSPAHPNLNNS